MSEWININEGKPEEGQRILAYFPSSRLNRKSEIGVITWDSSSWNEVTYWMPLPEPPKKKRWKPDEGNRYFMINETGIVCFRTQYNSIHDNSLRNFKGVYRTEEEAEQMAEKIRRFVTEQIGEV